MDFAGEDVGRFLLQKGDLLVCEGGEVGRSAIWESPIENCFYQKALHRLRARSPRHDTPTFLLYALNAASSSGVFTGGSGKTTIAHLPAEAFRRYRFAFPPSEEQENIVVFLEVEARKFAALTSEVKNGISLLKERRSALISAAVTGKIDVRGLVEADSSIQAAAE